MKRSLPADGVTPKSTGSRPRSLRLLVHAVDGCVPFLTPDALERHFPPSDDLWIGMAVRDTCVMPVFTESKGKPSKSKAKNNYVKANPGSQSSAPALNPKSQRDPKKPRVYSFLPVTPDSWLLPYTRVTVPSFDWMQDNARQKVSKGQRPPSGSTSTNQHILVWTPHGRQKLTPELYGQASSSMGGLKSHYTLSLYDMNEELGSAKRLEKADARNKEWFQDLLKRRSEESSSDDSLWSPLLLLSQEESKSSVLTMYHGSSEDVDGVALIGRWRPGLESLLQDHLSDIPHVAMLSTYSLSEILQIARAGVVDTIGTDLPNEWAKNKLALALDWSVTASTTKRSKLDPIAASEPTLNEDGCMEMGDKVFARDSQSLVPGCQCLACADDKFSRAYIHHLICAKELLAEILLFGHNLHHLLGLIRKLNESEDREELLRSVSNQLASDPEGHGAKERKMSQ